MGERKQDMAPRFPKEGRQADLQELIPYLVSIRSFEIQPKGMFGTSMKLVYELVDDPQQTIWDFLNYLDVDDNAKLGKSPAGDVSRFRAFCNAVGGRPEDAKVACFDDELMEIVWAEGGELVLEPGLRLRVSGELRGRGDGEGTMFHVIRYGPAATSIDPNDVP
jgi:hypothetical protein